MSWETILKFKNIPWVDICPSISVKDKKRFYYSWGNRFWLICKLKYLYFTCAVQGFILKNKWPGKTHKLLLVCRLGFMQFPYLIPVIVVVCSSYTYKIVTIIIRSHYMIKLFHWSRWKNRRKTNIFFSTFALIGTHTRTIWETQWKL